MSDLAKIAFGILSLKTFQGNVAALGVRQLADLSGKSKSAVDRAVRELVEAGHIQPIARRRGQRAYYMLTSPVFAKKQRSGQVDEIQAFGPASAPRERLVSVRTA